ncbi:MAG TPA: YraN family protein, partial [Flavisolibacter sp.]
KARSSKNFALPEEKVTKAKFRSLVQAANAYLRQHPHRLIRFDIISITAIPGKKPEYFFIEDVYFNN